MEGSGIVRLNQQVAFYSRNFRASCDKSYFYHTTHVSISITVYSFQHAVIDSLFYLKKYNKRSASNKIKQQTQTTFWWWNSYWNPVLKSFESEMNRDESEMNIEMRTVLHCMSRTFISFLVHMQWQDLLRLTALNNNQLKV